MSIQYLIVTKPVSSLQFDAISPGTAVLTDVVASLKQMTAILRPDGKTRFQIYSWGGTDLFSGIFMRSDPPLTEVSNIFGGDQNSQGVEGVEILAMAPPESLSVSVAGS